MRTIQVAVFAALLFTSNAVRAADTCAGGPIDQWKTADQVKLAANEHGYTHVVKVIIEDGCYEAVTINAQGKIIGVQFDPVTLRLAKVEDPR